MPSLSQSMQAHSTQFAIDMQTLTRLRTLYETLIANHKQYIHLNGSSVRVHTKTLMDRFRARLNLNPDERDENRRTITSLRTSIETMPGLSTTLRQTLVNQLTGMERRAAPLPARTAAQILSEALTDALRNLHDLDTGITAGWKLTHSLTKNIILDVAASGFVFPSTQNADTAETILSSNFGVSHTALDTLLPELKEFVFRQLKTYTETTRLTPGHEELLLACQKYLAHAHLQYLMPAHDIGDMRQKIDQALPQKSFAPINIAATVQSFVQLH